MSHVKRVFVSMVVGSIAVAPSYAQAPAAPRAAPAPAGYRGLGAESVSPADLARFAPGPLDAKVTRRIQSMLDVRGAGDGVITSTGDRMFFTWRVTGTHQVWRQDGPMQFPVQLTGGEDRTTVVGIAPNDAFIVVARDVGGQENPGLYLMAASGGPLRRIQHAPKVQTKLLFVSDDSKSVYYSANDVTPASYALYRFDVATGQRARVFDTPGLWTLADQRGGRWLLAKLVGNTQREIYEYELATRRLTPLLGQGDPQQYQVAYGAKPGQILVRTNILGDFHRLYALDARDPARRLAPITPAQPFDVDGFAIDDARARIYYTVNRDGYARTHALDAATLRPLALPALPAAESTDFAGVSHDGRFVQLVLEGSAALAETVTFDWQTRALTRWRAPSAPEVDPRAFAKAALESYPARDGTRIPMFVRRPAKCDAPCPVIVDFHGGPEGQSRPGFSGYAQLFVDAGFVYVEPNVRGSAGYGKAWLDADNGPKRLAVITDIEDCARYIRTAWRAGGKEPKIGVTGGSYGGYSTLMAMTYFAGAYDAGVQIVGISNLVTFLMNTAPYRRILRISEYGDPVKDRQALTQLSPTTHVGKLRAPLLSIQGVNDPRVPVGEALQIYRAAAARKIPGGLILFPDEGHGVAKRANQVLAIGHTLAFFERHLK